MFNFSFSELLVIGVIALVVLGPEKLPGAARTAGMWVSKLRRTVNDLQREVTSQFEAEELRRELKDTQNKLDSGLSRLRQSLTQSENSIRDSLNRDAINSANGTDDTESASSTKTLKSSDSSAIPSPPPAPPEVRAAPPPPPLPMQRPVIARHVLHAPLEELPQREKNSASDESTSPDMRKE